MAFYNRDSRSGGGGRSFGPRRSFGDRGDRGPREMHSAVCGKCGKDCQVPFRPTGERPVYCSECFDRNSAGGESRSYDDRRPSRPNYENHSRGNDSPKTNDQFNTLNAKLDKIISLLSGSTSKEEAKTTVKEEKMKQLSDISELLGEPPKNS